MKGIEKRHLPPQPSHTFKSNLLKKQKCSNYFYSSSSQVKRQLIFMLSVPKLVNLLFCRHYTLNPNFSFRPTSIWVQKACPFIEHTSRLLYSKTLFSFEIFSATKLITFAIKSMLFKFWLINLHFRRNNLYFEQFEYTKHERG